jgi:hypothetical protein
MRLNEVHVKDAKYLAVTPQGQVDQGLNPLGVGNAPGDLRMLGHILNDGNLACRRHLPDDPFSRAEGHGSEGRRAESTGGADDEALAGRIPDHDRALVRVQQVDGDVDETLQHLLHVQRAV